jgi:hypothetical protein
MNEGKRKFAASGSGDVVATTSSVLSGAAILADLKRGACSGRRLRSPSSGGSDSVPLNLSDRAGRIAISQAAFDAIVSTLPGNVGFENQRDTNGDWFIWLPHDVLAKFNALRGPGDSYSDAILALAER